MAKVIEIDCCGKCPYVKFGLDVYQCTHPGVAMKVQALAFYHVWEFPKNIIENKTIQEWCPLPDNIEREAWVRKIKQIARCYKIYCPQCAKEIEEIIEEDLDEFRGRNYGG